MLPGMLTTKDAQDLYVRWELTVLLELKRTQVRGEPDTLVGLKTTVRDINL